jgi:D-alanine-D-alanine ligase
MSSIVVLSGGISNEREVSQRSGNAVADALRAKGHTATILDPATDMAKIGKPDAVFPALHGVGGEDGTVQAALEMAGVPYVGSGVAASALCFDKWLYRQVLSSAGLPVAKGELVTTLTIWDSPLAKAPFVLKPIQGGSTLDTFIIREPAAADKDALHACLNKYGLMLLEELVPGIELTVAVLGDKAMPAVEIIPPENGEFDYENKYNGRTQELCPPQHIDDETHAKIQELALKAHQLTGCRDLSRTDIMAAPNGRLVILETNTLPGMTNQSLFPKAAAAGGVPMSELIDRLVGWAVERR